MKMEWFIVRHKPTGAYMPEMGRGYTYWEPPAMNPCGEKPRLFPSKHGAKQAVAAWARGEHVRQTGRTGDLWGCDDWSAVEVVPGTQRDASELEVCVVEINIKENNG